MRIRCPYCQHGRVIIEGNVGHRCEDCDGTGWIWNEDKSEIRASERKHGEQHKEPEE